MAPKKIKKLKGGAELINNRVKLSGSTDMKTGDVTTKYECLKCGKTETVLGVTRQLKDYIRREANLHDCTPPKVNNIENTRKDIYG